MNAKNLLDLKTQLEAFRQKIDEEISDTDQLIRLRMNGQFHVLSLKIQPELATEKIEQLLPVLFTRAIDAVAEQIRTKLENLQAAQN